MKYSFLLDNNIYRLLTKLKMGDELDNFNSSIKKHRLLKNIPQKNINYSLTPFSIMEAIGITIPNPNIPIPEKFSNVQKRKELVEYLKKEARTYYSELDRISIKEIISSAEKQKKYTSKKAETIDNIFIQKPIKLNGYHEYFIESLIFDYVCKYEFPKPLQKLIFSEFLIPSFFWNDNITSRFSKFRIIKRLWDNTIYELENNTRYPKELIKNLKNSMKLERNKDFLDCEIIHFACVGDYVNGKFNPVFAFTTDNKDVIINRIIVYKSMIHFFLNNISDKSYELKHNVINDWKQGMIIFCNKDGSFNDSIDVSDILGLN